MNQFLRNVFFAFLINFIGISSMVVAQNIIDGSDIISNGVSGNSIVITNGVVNCGGVICAKGTFKCVIQQQTSNNSKLIETTKQCLTESGTILSKNVTSTANPNPGNQVQSVSSATINGDIINDFNGGHPLTPEQQKQLKAKLAKQAAALKARLAIVLAGVAARNLQIQKQNEQRQQQLQARLAHLFDSIQNQDKQLTTKVATALYQVAATKQPSTNSTTSANPTNSTKLQHVKALVAKVLTDIKSKQSQSKSIPAQKQNVPTTSVASLVSQLVNARNQRIQANIERQQQQTDRHVARVLAQVAIRNKRIQQRLQQKLQQIKRQVIANVIAQELVPSSSSLLSSLNGENSNSNYSPYSAYTGYY